MLAVIPLFYNHLCRLFSKWREPANFDYLLKIAAAFVITGVGGVILEKKHFKLPEELAPVAWALLIGGVLFIFAERWVRGKHLRDDVSWAVTLAVGLGQLVAAIFPGSSRSGSTILPSLLLGLSRPAATEFSFLVGIPTMLAAGGLKIFKALHHPAANAPHENWSLLLLATVVASAVSFIVVKWMLRYVQNHTFNAFAIYRILLGGSLLSWLFMRH